MRSAITSPDPNSWRAYLRRRVEDVGRTFRGRVKLAATVSDEVIDAERYLDAPYLRAALERARMAFGAPDPRMRQADLRVAASSFMRAYAAAVSGASFVALVHGLAIDTSISRCRIVVEGDVPFALLLEEDQLYAVGPDASCAVADAPRLPELDLRERAWLALYSQNLALIVDAIERVVRVARRMLWSNVAEWPALLAERGARARPPYGQRYEREGAAVLDAEYLPGLHGPNPLRRLVRWETVNDPRLPHGIHVREVCCITYLQANRLGRLCTNCPHLETSDRLALILEREGDGGDGGPVVDRVTRIGRRLIRT